MLALIEAFSVNVPETAIFIMKAKRPYRNINLPNTLIPLQIQWTGFAWECITRLVFKPSNLTASAAKTAPTILFMMSAIVFDSISNYWNMLETRQITAKVLNDFGNI